MIYKRGRYYYLDISIPGQKKRIRESLHTTKKLTALTRAAQRKEELIKQAKWIVGLVPELAKTREEKENPWINYNVIHRMVKFGIFDAPHLKNNKYALGKITTRVINGGCYSWDLIRNKKLDEIERIKTLITDNKASFMDFDMKSKISPEEVKIK